MFYRLIGPLYYMSAHYSKEKLRQLIMQNIMYAITQYYYALNSFIDLLVAHFTVFRAINKGCSPPD